MCKDTKFIAEAEKFNFIKTKCSFYLMIISAQLILIYIDKI
jgi:hypothetical protein